MNNIVPYVICFAAGAALVGAWWWWINHRAKARALLQGAEQVAKKL
jgi:hypothetical protein